MLHIHTLFEQVRYMFHFKFEIIKKSFINPFKLGFNLGWYIIWYNLLLITNYFKQLKIQNDTPAFYCVAFLRIFAILRKCIIAFMLKYVKYNMLNNG